MNSAIHMHPDDWQTEPPSVNLIAPIYEPVDPGEASKDTDDPFLPNSDRAVMPQIPNPIFQAPVIPDDSTSRDVGRRNGVFRTVSSSRAVSSKTTNRPSSDSPGEIDRGNQQKPATEDSNPVRWPQWLRPIRQAIYKSE
jgi:hypothetical protein